MGNDNSQIEKFTDASLANFNNFIIVEDQEIQDIFGKCTLFQKKNKSNEYVICKKISIGNEIRQKSIQQFLEQRMQIQHTNSLKFYGYSLCKQNSFCSTNFSFNAYYEYHPISLLQENNNRQNNEEFYQLNEMWYMAKCLLGFCEYLQQNEEVHPNIHPSTIYLTESGQLKLIDSSILTLNSPSQKVNQNQTEMNIQSLNSEQRYIAPEEVINQKNMNKFKLSVFQIGMTLLESALIQDCSYIYLEDDSINQNSLDFLLNKVQEIYGDSFAIFLKKFLNLNPNNRPDLFEAIQIQNKLIDNGNQSFRTNPGFSENGVGEGSPALPSIRLNSSLVNQIGNPNQFNQFDSNLYKNNKNSSRISTGINNFTSNNSQVKIIMNQQKQQDYVSEPNKVLNYNFIKSPESFQQRFNQSDANLMNFKQISLSNSPLNRDNFESNIQMNSSNIPLQNNYQSYSNTMKNPQVDYNSKQNNQYILNNSQQITNQHKKNPQIEQQYIYDIKDHSQVKFVESQIKMHHLNQTPPKNRLIQENSSTTIQKFQPQFQNNTVSSSQPTAMPKNQNNIISSSQPTTIPKNQGYTNLYASQQHVTKQTNPQIIYVDYKIQQGASQITPANDQQSLPPQLSYSSFNPNFSQSFEQKGQNKTIDYGQGVNPAPFYKSYYSKSNSPQNETKVIQNQEAYSFVDPNKTQDSNKIQIIQHNKAQNIPFQETQKKAENYYSNGNNTSYSQNLNQGNSIPQIKQPQIIQAQRKFTSNQGPQNESSIERNGQNGGNPQQAKKQTKITTIQKINPNQIAQNLAQR